VDGWVNALKNSWTPATVAYAFAASHERERQRVVQDYWDYLRRQASDAEVDGWVTAFSNGRANEEVVTGLISSAEYYQTHSPVARGTNWPALSQSISDE
jgi:hypothetical protein